MKIRTSTWSLLLWMAGIGCLLGGWRLLPPLSVATGIRLLQFVPPALAFVLSCYLVCSYPPRQTNIATRAASLWAISTSLPAVLAFGWALWLVQGLELSNYWDWSRDWPEFCLHLSLVIVHCASLSANCIVLSVAGRLWVGLHESDHRAPTPL